MVECLITIAAVLGIYFLVRPDSVDFDSASLLLPADPLPLSPQLFEFCPACGQTLQLSGSDCSLRHVYWSEKNEGDCDS